MEISASSRFRNRPRMLICYLCGREFGSKSLPIHIPQCQKKWLLEEEQKPKKERRPLPPQPAAEKAIRTGGARAIDEFNSEAFAAFEQTLEQCPHCQRRFLPKAFKHHSKACTARHPAKPAGTGLISNSLSNRMTPGPIAGSNHGNTKLLLPQNKSGLYNPSMKQKIRSAGLQEDVNKYSPVGRDAGQSSKSSTSCGECGTQYQQPDSNFCSQCGSKRVGNKQHVSHVFHDVQQLGKRNLTPLKTTNSQNVLSPLQQNKNGSLRQRLDLVEASPHAKHSQTEFHPPVLVENLRCLNLGQGGLKRNFIQRKDVQHYGSLF